MTIFLGIICAILALCLIGVLYAAYWQHEQMLDRLDDERSAHEACHVAVEKRLTEAATSRDKAQAALLRRLAAKYDSPMNVVPLHRVEAKYTSDGPSIPALWMLAEADELDPPHDDLLVEVHTFGGDTIEVRR